MAELRRRVHSTNENEPLGPVLERVSRAEIVLIGEASHGTREFYETRAALTRRLISDHGFAAVVAEADWPDAYRVNRFVRGAGDDRSADRALRDFERFPTWMWRNREVEQLVGWLRQHNDALHGAAKVGFYGMDLYSLHRSMAVVVETLERLDPDAAARARERYGCFEDFGPEPQAYGYAVGFGASADCEEQVVAQLMDIRQQVELRVSRDGLAGDEALCLEQNARLVKNAERYYRGMFSRRTNTWNLRDTHMTETIESVRDHLSDARGERAKLVVWAHNSHLGDARYTDRADVGEVNVGQLVRERHGDRCAIVGFTTDRGRVAAADEWDGPVKHKRVRTSLEGSWERVLHGVGLEGFSVIMDEAGDLLRGRLLNRAIGVIYRPETERMSHYFVSELSRQFDVVIHVDETRAVRPLEAPAHWDRHDLPETYPRGL